MKLRPLIHTKGASSGRRSTMDGYTIRLPQAYRGFSGQSGLALIRARSRTLGSHRLTPAAFPPRKPQALAGRVVSLVEDARVEQLAIRRFPGCASCGQTFHVAQPGGAVTSASLMARLARALIDGTIATTIPWWRRPAPVLRAARLLGRPGDQPRARWACSATTWAQMRVQFTTRPTWSSRPTVTTTGRLGFRRCRRTAGEDDDVVMQGARLTRRREGAGTGRRRATPAAGAGREKSAFRPSRFSEALKEEPLSPPMRYDE